jgi:aspartyl/asparaginyl beta-hydroxylase (cupin superfamily)
MKDDEGEEAALRGALTIDPYELVALVLRARLYRRQGKRQPAASACAAVAVVAPPMHTLPPDMQQAVSEILAWHDAYNREFGAFMDEFMAPHLHEMQGENLRRFRESLDILTGRKRRYDSQSAMFHFHGLAPISFFERSEFPWLDALEAQTSAIREEFLAVLGAQEGFTPYINYSEDQPLEQWAELNKSLSWSAFRLIEAGERIEENAARCPVTMQALRGAPQPVQPGRTPSAMFSVLKPKTRIPPHTGVSNARVVAHLPLIVPPGCGFRVGNDTREWTPGQGFVFDDTIEHEAWNDSDQLRVVLIFDVWHPHLSAAERAMITAMSAGLKQFTQSAGGFGL